MTAEDKIKKISKIKAFYRGMIISDGGLRTRLLYSYLRPPRLMRRGENADRRRKG